MTRARFLEKDPDDLEAFLLQVARQDVAPREARERALRNVSAAAAGMAAVSAASSYSAGSLPLKMTGWLAGKWLVVGVAAGLLSVGAAEAVAQLTGEAQSGSATRHSGVQARATLDGALSKRLPVDALRPPADAPAQSEPELLDSGPIAPRGTGPLPTPSAVDAPAHEPSTAPTPHWAPSATSPPEATSPAGVSALSRELAFLESARRALSAGAPAAAGAALDHYEAEFPSGSLRVEAAALRIEAIGQSGDAVRARELAESFLNDHPTSPLAERVRAVARAFHRETRKQ